MATFDLFADTGWWRGSNHYLHQSGHYVLHDGQAGCIVFDAWPTPSNPGFVVDCEKATVKPQHGLRDQTVPPGAVPSQVFSDLIYIGHFAEDARNDPPIRYIPAQDGPEPEPSDPL